MRIFLLLVLCICSAFVLSAQTALGTITGVVTDQTGAVVANAPVEAKNVETGVVTKAVSTETGNYTLSQLAVGRYEVSVTVQGFKKYNRQGLTLSAAQVMRLDVGLEVGSNAETVTVTAESTLLKTENSELAHNVTIRQLDNLPILPVNGGGVSGSSSSGFRDPFSLTQLIPGTDYSASNTIRVNGLPNASENVLIEGQTGGAVNQGAKGFTHQTQPSVDAIQEVAVQTSNFAAEFGQVGGGIFNVTMRSGTNQYHGTVYDYAVNEALNAAAPYSGLKSAQKRHDYGGTLGGPVRVPKLYNGANKTFFFFNFEQYRENIHVANTAGTVPTALERAGDFRQAPCYTGTVINQACNPGDYTPKFLTTGSGASQTNYVDPLGRTIAGGTIFDPRSERQVACNAAAFPTSTCAKSGQNGQLFLVRDPFTNNVVPSNLFDPVALRILNLVPLPTGPTAQAGIQLNGNYQNNWLSHRTSQIPSVKLDHQLSAKGHLSLYWGDTVTESQFSFPNGNSVGLPEPIDPARGTFIYSRTLRGNYDHTLTPTILLHIGVGFNSENFWDNPPVENYNAAAPQSCSSGSTVPGLTQTCKGGLGWNFAGLGGLFPQFIPTPEPPLVPIPVTGGMTSTGPAGSIHSSGFTEHRPSANANASWVRGNHTYKLGIEGWYAQIPTQDLGNTSGTWTFGGSTVQPALQSVTLSGGSPTTGFTLADFLMGNLTSVTLAVPADYSNRKKQIGLFLQDTWKITRKLTFDYGLRWDYGTYAKEQYGRTADFSPTVANPSAGGHPGAQIFESNCHCSFADNYPYAIGPRLGVAYQINSKTVIRAGVGIVYNTTGIIGGTVNRTGSSPALSFGQYITDNPLSQGLPSTVSPRWPSEDPALGQTPGSIVTAPTLLDRNAGRPMRQWQWNLTLQREITRNFVVEAAYVANRVNWLSAPLVPGYNDMSVEQLNKLGFTIPTPTSPNSAVTADASLLRALFTNLSATQKSTLVARGISLNGPYNGFPVSGLSTQAVRQAIRPFPQYSSSIAPSGAPVGKSWYDALQLTVTKRLSHGLSVNANYTYSKTLDLISTPDIFNPLLGKDLAASDRPHQLRISADYTTPRLHDGVLGRNKIIAYILSDWGTGWFLQYQSAGAIGQPSSSGTDPITNYLNRGTLVANRAKDANGNYISPWAVNWTDLDGKVHPEPIDINCKCFNPQYTQVLNPAAWTSVNNGAWSDSYATIRDYRGIRTPQENVNFSRSFRYKERLNFTVRAEWANAFNRLRLPAPSSGTFGTPLTKASNGTYSGGFGSIVIPGTGTGGARTGNIVLRLQF
jgi:hypothetical protein